MDLILHVGLPKTGTTFIQKHYFSKHNGYIGKSNGGTKNITGSNDEVLEFRYLSTGHHLLRDEEVIDRTKKWINRVRQYLNENDSNSVFTLSDENLIGSRKDYDSEIDVVRWWGEQYYDRKRPVELAEYLKKFLVPIWTQYGKVRVVITLRNQSEYLASLYSQQTHRIPFASQNDFEQQVLKVIDNDETVKDYYGLIEDIAKAVGWDNVLSLLYEDMNTLQFWKKLSSFISKDHVNCYELTNGSIQHENVSSFKDNVWRIKFFKGNTFRHNLKRIWPKERLPILRKVLIRACAKIFDPILMWKNNLRRETSFYLSPEIKEYIRNKCKAGNKKLSNWLGREITDLGY